MFLSEQKLTIISFFIGPAIVAALISGVFSLTISRRSERLKNVTAERSKWRDKVRQIAEDIQPEDEARLKTALNTLKLYINAYGIEDSIAAVPRFQAKYILMDTHIWILIYQMENAIREGGQIDSECELLRKYLSLLFKYDWERAKSEVNRSIAYIVGWIFMLCSMFATFIMPIYFSTQANKIVDNKDIFLTVIGTTSVLLISNVYESAKRKSLREKAVDKYNGFVKKDDKVIDVFERLRPYENFSYYFYVLELTLLRCSVFGFISLFVSARLKELEIEPSKYNITCTGLLIFYMIGAAIVAKENKKIITNEYSYLVEINRISSKFYNLETMT